MDNTYINGVHKRGRIWGLILSFIILSYPFICCFIYGVTPDWQGLVAGLIGVIPIYWTIGLIELFTYVPMLGAGGTYLSFITGNISNLKLPVALDSLELANVKADTEEGEVVSTISIAVSSIVTTLVITVGMILIVPLAPLLESEALSASFAQILPALFGALAVVFFSKNLKIAATPVIIMLILFIFVPALNGSTVSIMVPIGAVIAIVASRILYKKGKL